MHLQCSLFMHKNCQEIIRIAPKNHPQEIPPEIISRISPQKTSKLVLTDLQLVSHCDSRLIRPWLSFTQPPPWNITILTSEYHYLDDSNICMLYFVSA